MTPAIQTESTRSSLFVFPVLDRSVVTRWIAKLASPVAAIVSGALFSLCQPGFDVPYISFVSLVPLLFVLRSASPWRSVLLSFLSGIASGLICSYWVFDSAGAYVGGTTVSGPMMYLSIASLQGLWFAVFGLFHSYYDRQRRRVFRSLGIVACWVAVEWMHESLFASFPWTLSFLSSAQWLNKPLLQWASFGGAHLVTTLVFIANLLLTDALRAPEQRKSHRTRIRSVVESSVPAVAWILFIHLFGYGLTPSASDSTVGRLTVALLQENVRAEDRWDDGRIDSLAGILLNLNRTAAGQRPDLIVWTETAIPWTFRADDDLLTVALNETRSSGAHHLIGMLSDGQRDGDVRNSILYVRPDGTVTGRYDKKELLLFLERPLFRFASGESILQLPFTQSRYDNIEPGSRSEVITTAFGPIGVMVCNESLTPFAANRGVDEGALALYSASNDAWFSGSVLVRMHLAKSVLRAVETRRDVVFNANGGYAGVVRMDGTIEASLSDGSPRVVQAGVALRTGRTLSVDYPSSVPFVALIIMASISLSPIIVRRFV